MYTSMHSWVASTPDYIRNRTHKSRVVVGIEGRKGGREEGRKGGRWGRDASGDRVIGTHHAEAHV